MDNNPRPSNEPTPESEQASTPVSTIISPTTQETAPQATAEPAPVALPIAEPVPASEGPVVNSMEPASVQPLKSGKRKPKLLIIGGALAGVLMLALAGYFALYLPNTPKNVYSRGLDRSGKALNMLVEKATASQQLKHFTASELTGDFSIKSNGKTFSGSISSKYDKQNSDSSLIYKGDETQNLAINVLTRVPDKAVYPDIYFKISGIKSLGLIDMMPALAVYDGKWISVSSAYLQSQLKNDLQSNLKPSDFTADDAASLVKIAANKTSEYFLTSDGKKAIFEQTKFLGAETLDDNIKANHYAVELNKDHLQAFCIDLATAAINSDAYKHLTGHSSDSAKQISDDKAKAIKGCKVDNSLGKDTYEIWINTKTHLMYKIRDNDAKDKGSYTELGQNYTSGNSLPIFVNQHDATSKTDIKADLTADLEKSSTSAKITVSTVAVNGLINLNFKPYSGNVKVTAPAGAVPIEQVLKSLGLGGSGQVGATSAGQRNVTQARNPVSQSSDKLPTLLKNLHF